MLTIKKVEHNSYTECSSCGKTRKKYFEIRYGIPSGFLWQPYSTLPLCASCLRKLGVSIEKKLSKQSRKKTEQEKPLIEPPEEVNQE